jgi:hypothetical protein
MNRQQSEPFRIPVIHQFPELSGEEQTEIYRYICAELWKMFFSGD